MTLNTFHLAGVSDKNVTRHYIQSSRLFYDYNYFDSKIGFGVISEGEFKRTPYVINF